VWIGLKDKQVRIAETISAVFNAPFTALYAFTILLFSIPHSSRLYLLIITSVFACFLPLIIIHIMVKRSIIPDMYASDRRTRTKPFIAAIASYVTGAIILVIVRAPQSLIALMACYIVNSIVMMMISRTWKISIHASGLAGPATFLLAQFGAIMLPFFALIFPIGWARLKLGAHDFSQVAAGALLTVGLTLLQVQLYLK